MKRILICLLLCMALATPALAEPLTQEQAEAAAWEAFPGVYQFTAKELATCTLLSGIPQHDASWEGYAFQFASVLGSFSVLVSKADGSVTCDPGAEAFWAQAHLSDEGRTARAAMAEGEAARSLAFDFWPLADKAHFALRYYPNAESEYHYCALPAEGELTLEQATDIARRTLTTQLGYSTGALDALLVAPWFFREQPGHEDGPHTYYRIVFWQKIGDSSTDLAFQTQVELDAATGEVLSFYDPAKAVG